MLKIDKIDNCNIRIRSGTTIDITVAAIFFSVSSNEKIITIAPQKTGAHRSFSDFLENIEINGISGSDFTVEDAVKELNSFIGNYTACCCGDDDGGSGFSKPVLSNFNITPDKIREVGEPVTVGTVFSWSVTYSGNVKPNSFVIRNETVGADVVTGHGTTSYTVSVPLFGRTTAGDFQFSVSGTDIEDNPITKITKNMSYGIMVHLGAVSSETIDATQLQALPKTIKTGFSGDYLMPGGGYQYICVPVAFGNPTNFIDAATGFNVPVIQQSGTITVVNDFGVSVEYNVWRTFFELINSFTLRLS